MIIEHDVYQLIHALLAEEEQREMACSTDLDLDERTPHIQRIKHLLAELDKHVAAYHHRYERLAARSRMEQVKWAQELLDMPHFALLDLYRDPADPTGRRCQAVVIDGTEAVLFEAVFTSFGVVSGPANEVQPFVKGVTSFMSALDGHFLGMSDARGAYEQLHRMTKRAGIHQPALAGISLFEVFQTYFQAQHPDYETLFQLDETIALAQLSERIGRPLDTQVIQSAKGRARGMLRALQALAQGFVDPKTKTTFLIQAPPASTKQSAHGEEKNGDDGFS